jgi:hypothetical protein
MNCAEVILLTMISIIPLEIGPSVHIQAVFHEYWTDILYILAFVGIRPLVLDHLLEQFYACTKMATKVSLPIPSQLSMIAVSTCSRFAE